MSSSKLFIITATNLMMCMMFFALTLPAGNEATGQSIDPAKLTKSRKVVESQIKVGDTPLDIAISPVDGTIYVTQYNTGEISVIQYNALQKKVKISGRLTGIAITEDGKTLYVGIDGDNALGVVDTATMKLKKKVPVCAFPIGVRLSKDERYVGVVCNGSSQATFVSTSTWQSKTIKVGAQPYYMGADFLGHKLPPFYCS